MSAANRVTCYARGLKSNGVQVKVLMPFAFVVDPMNKFSQKGSYNGVEYEYLGFIDDHPKRKYFFPASYIIYFIKKAYGYLSYFWYFINHRKEYDVLYLYENRAFFILLILLFNRKKSSVLEVCEIPYFHFDGYRKKIHRFIIEKLILPQLDGFVVISSNLEDYINLHKSKKALIIKVPILTSISYSSPLETNRIRQQIKPSVPYILHAGSISEKKEGIIGMVEAFGIALKSLSFPFKFIIAGDFENSPVRDDLRLLIKKHDLNESVEFTGVLKGEQLVKVQANSSLTIINRTPTEQNKYGFPTKLGEFMSLGVPVIATSIGEMSLFLIDRVNAYVIPPGNVNLLAETIIDAMRNEQERKAIGQVGRLYAKKEFDPDYHGGRMLKFFEELCNPLISNNT